MCPTSSLLTPTSTAALTARSHPLAAPLPVAWHLSRSPLHASRCSAHLHCPPVSPPRSKQVISKQVSHSASKAVSQSFRQLSPCLPRRVSPSRCASSLLTYHLSVSSSRSHVLTYVNYSQSIVTFTLYEQLSTVLQQALMPAAVRATGARGAASAASAASATQGRPLHHMASREARGEEERGEEERGEETCEAHEGLGVGHRKRRQGPTSSAVSKGRREQLRETESAHIITRTRSECRG